ncbi:unnamed protein product [Caenorhabditis nigoni]
MPIELQQEPMKPDDDFDVAEDKLDHFDHFPALMEEVLDQQRKEMLHPKKSMAFLPVSFDAWLDANVDGWRTENLDGVNERLANWGPIQLSTANNVIIYGVVRVFAATQQGVPAGCWLCVKSTLRGSVANLPYCSIRLCGGGGGTIPFYWRTIIAADCPSACGFCNDGGYVDGLRQRHLHLQRRRYARLSSCIIILKISCGQGFSPLAPTSISCWKEDPGRSLIHRIARTTIVYRNEDDDDGGSATCSDGYVFYEDGCVPIEDSPKCQLADDTEEEPYDSFDCSSKRDGLYSIGCVNQFVNCVSGQAYQMY